ncbi:hypothetical protein Pint_27461 [Pistacia integerrima]|uniref:Uncharacterized protein n=1 Tax=Pistacia integerrima TaxID=434235 RepID=A0ACC0YS73_9ROSI|nr:hypothetical protein Pint_27461 [Pistacia integerrima]
MVVAPSSPLSAESSFRELDDAFLQTQTRIWLGEVLQTRLNENMDISDLLADGELLFEVSRVVWQMLLATRMELKHIKAYKYEPFAYGKSSRRYMPYSNVDIFLKDGAYLVCTVGFFVLCTHITIKMLKPKHICKMLGLTGIDLFSPSDVVEKKNTRKVCMCIRLLSNKARSKQLNVPDFDVVTYAVAMPTDMVGCIRRSLEQSQHIFLSTASQNSSHVLIANSRERNSIVGSNGNYGLFPEQSDDSACNLIIQSDASSPNSHYDASSQLNFYSVDSLGVSAVVGKSAPGDQFSPLEVENQEQNEYTHEFESPCLNESAGSVCSLLWENDYHLDGLSSTSCVDSPIHLDGRASHTKTRSRHSYEIRTLDFSYSDLDMQIGAGEDSTGDGTQEKNNVLPIAISTMVCHELDTNDPIQFDGDNSIFNGYTSPSSHGSNSTPRTVENGFRSKLADVNDEEFSSTPRIISLPGVSQNMNFDDQEDAGHDFKTFWLPEVQHGEADHKTQNAVKNKTLMYCSKPKAEEPLIDIKFIQESFNTNLLQPCSDSPSCITGNSDHGVVYDNGICKSLDPNVGIDEGKCSQLDSDCLKNVNCNQCLDSLAQSYSPLDLHLWNQKGKCVVGIISDENDGNEGNKTSPNSILHEGLHGEIAGGDALVHEDIKSGVIQNDKEKNHSSSAEDVDNGHSEVLKQNEVVESVENSDRTDDPGVQLARHKSGRRLLLMSVASGSAVVGALFVLLHLRKSGGEKTGDSNMQYKKKKESGMQLSPQNKQKEVRVNGIYPAKKLAFGL